MYTNISWKKIVSSISAESNYNKMNDDQRYEFLKKFISVHLSTAEYERAIESLCDYLWGDEVTHGKN